MVSFSVLFSLQSYGIISKQRHFAYGKRLHGIYFITTINQSIVILSTLYLMETSGKAYKLSPPLLTICFEKTKARLTTSVPSINYVLSRLLLGKLRCPFLVQEGVERCRKNSPMGYGIIPLGCAARCLGWQIGPLGCEISCLELQKKARFAHKTGHHDARFLPFDDGILQFCVADMCVKVQGKTSELGVFAVFQGLKKRIWTPFCPIFVSTQPEQSVS